MQSIQYIESPNCWKSRQGYRPLWLILHGTAGGTSAVNVANWFANPQSQVSAHYIVDRDGSVVQCVPEAWAAWADGGVTGPSGISGDGIHHDYWWDNQPNPNYVTISIEHVKASEDNSDELTVAQINASFALIDDICGNWNIPRRYADQNGGIIGHYSMDPMNKSRCPGPYPWTQLWEYLQGDTAVGVPQGWTDDGTTLKAPSGFVVVRGFRDYILNNPWEAWNWPVENEHGQTPLEISDLTLGGGTQQLFRLQPLGWTPGRGVFPQWTGPEILALRAEIASLKAQIAALTTPPPPPAAPAQQMPKAS